LYHEYDDLTCLLALSFVKDIGPVTAKKLLSHFRSPRKIFEVGLAGLMAVEDVSNSRAEAIRDFDGWERVEKEKRAIKQLNINIIKYTDNDYPETLRQLDDAPVLLFTKGTLIAEDRYAVAMVGSRKMTAYGSYMANRISADLAACGITVVSGMARGIDTVSHKGALRAGGRSIAVLGCGLDTPYPPENRELFGELGLSGCVISEFPVGTPPNRENFPRRNRLISGLSMGVVVVEAAMDSGSLITAHYALEQNKEVFAVPGPVTSHFSEGTNELIRKGARLVRKAEDILEELSPQIKGLMRSGERAVCHPPQLEINDEEKAICSILEGGPRHVDIIARELAMPPSQLSGLLLGLEIKGLVRKTEGNNFYIR